MRVHPLSDTAWLLTDLPQPAHLVAEILRRAELPGVVDIVAAYDDVAIYGDRSAPLLDRSLLNCLATEVPLSVQVEHHRVPVCYELGDDTTEVCGRLKLTVDQLASLHSGTAYQCAAVGFAPGFGYLGELPQELQGVPRRPSPRTRVEPGSVAITGKQTAVYPQATPGGWALIGRCPLELVNEADDYFPLRAGDRVEFFRIDEAEFESLRGVRL